MSQILPIRENVSVLEVVLESLLKAVIKSALKSPVEEKNIKSWSPEICVRLLEVGLTKIRGALETLSIVRPCRTPCRLFQP